MDVVGIVSLKGGVGKTTLCCSMAVTMANKLRRGKKILVVDSDPQGNASLTMLDGQEPEEPTLTEVLVNDAEAVDAIRRSRHPKIDLLPANVSLSDVTLLLSDQIGRENRLKSALATLGTSYGTCLIDATPTMSLININVLNAASKLIVPIDPSVYSQSGLTKLHETVEIVRKHLCHHELAIVALVLVRIRKHPTHRKFEKDIREIYGSLVCETTIPDAIEVQAASGKHRTIGEIAPASDAAKRFDQLVEELAHVKDTGSAKGNSRTHGGTSGKRRAG